MIFSINAALSKENFLNCIVCLHWAWHTKAYVVAKKSNMENYKKVKVLGKGAFGKVYLVLHKQVCAVYYFSNC